MKKALYAFVHFIALIHDRVLRLNDSFSAELSDKQLHFLVVGFFGILLFFAVHALFRRLVRSGHLSAVSWIYVFTVILMLTFAIEIGQHVSHTGTLEFADIVYGVVGFFFFYGVYAVMRALVRLILRLKKQ